MKINRRDFIKITGASLAGSVLPSFAWGSDRTEQFTDFKALVVVNFMGGNDGLSTFIPSDDQSGIYTGYETYAQLRNDQTRIDANDYMSDLQALVDTDGHISIGSNNDHPYYDDSKDPGICVKKGFYRHQSHNFDGKIATNIMMPELAQWIENGYGAVIHNVGNISGPWSKQQLKDDPLKVPPFLYSHNLQERLVLTGQASSVTEPTGWLGRLADEWDVSNDNVYTMNVNLSDMRASPALYGVKTSPMNYSSHGPITLDSYAYEDVMEQAFADPNHSSTDIFEKLYIRTRVRAYDQMVKTVADWQWVTMDANPYSGITDSYGNTIFDRSSANSRDSEVTDVQVALKPISFGGLESLKTAARLISIANNNGMKRIAIFVDLGGYDQHGNLLHDHGLRMRSASIGIDVFMRAMEKAGLLDKVAMLTTSEFGRSTGSNGNGTDHAWGGSQFVLGAVNPGMYGNMPDLRSESEDDFTRKGRLIPTTSFTQYYATILKWFGATDTEIGNVLPELSNFSNTDIGFMKS